MESLFYKTHTTMKLKQENKIMSLHFNHNDQALFSHENKYLSNSIWIVTCNFCITFCKLARFFFSLKVLKYIYTYPQRLFCIPTARNFSFERYLSSVLNFSSEIFLDKLWKLKNPNLVGAISAVP